MSAIGLNSLETRMKVLSPNCYSLKKYSGCFCEMSFLKARLFCNLDVKTLFGKSTHREIGKKLVRTLYGNEDFTSILVHDLMCRVYPLP